jgi:hypothetical protein
MIFLFDKSNGGHSAKRYVWVFNSMLHVNEFLKNHSKNEHATELSEPLIGFEDIYDNEFLHDEWIPERTFLLEKMGKLITKKGLYCNWFKNEKEFKEHRKHYKILLDIYPPKKIVLYN